MVIYTHEKLQPILTSDYPSYTDDEYRDAVLSLRENLRILCKYPDPLVKDTVLKRLDDTMTMLTRENTANTANFFLNISKIDICCYVYVINMPDIDTSYRCFEHIELIRAAKSTDNLDIYVYSNKHLIEDGCVNGEIHIMIDPLSTRYWLCFDEDILYEDIEEYTCLMIAMSEALDDRVLAKYMLKISSMRFMNLVITISCGEHGAYRLASIYNLFLASHTTNSRISPYHILVSSIELRLWNEISLLDKFNLRCFCEKLMRYLLTGVCQPYYEKMYELLENGLITGDTLGHCIDVMLDIDVVEMFSANNHAMRVFTHICRLISMIISEYVVEPSGCLSEFNEMYSRNVIMYRANKYILLASDIGDFYMVVKIDGCMENLNYIFMDDNNCEYDDESIQSLVTIASGYFNTKAKNAYKVV